MSPPVTSAPTPASPAPSVGFATVCALSWFIPGAGHFVLGQFRKALILFVVLTLMFILGLTFGGREFPFQLNEPLVFLAAVAEWALVLPRAVAAIAGLGQGIVTAATYEYGNTFLIVSGLLNTLVMLDAYDVATGRKAR